MKYHHLMFSFRPAQADDGSSVFRLGQEIGKYEKEGWEAVNTQILADGGSFICFVTMKKPLQDTTEEQLSHIKEVLRRLIRASMSPRNEDTMAEIMQLADEIGVKP